MRNGFIMNPFIRSSLQAMTTLTIKDVPEPLAERLRQRAARNHRSLQGELMSIIEQAAHPAPDVASAPGPALTAMAHAPAIGSRAAVVGYDRRGQPITRQGWKTIEQIHAELKAKYPEPIRDQVSSIQLIREDRDNR